jgi:hypothetical protein
VVSNMAGLFSSYGWDVILPIDEVHHFSRWVGQPPTRYIYIHIANNPIIFIVGY